jgi:hypothetical protein
VVVVVVRVAAAAGVGGCWLLVLLLVADAARVGLVLTDLAEEEAHSSCGEGVGLGPAAVLLERGTEVAHERVDAAPRLAQRVGAWRWEEYEWWPLKRHAGEQKKSNFSHAAREITIG